jgi:hypothetical protein
MKPAAIGIRMHSGWGALVAVSNSAGTVEIIERRRIAITTPGTPGANKPYHFAENLDFPEAEKFLANCAAASKRLASAAVRDVVSELCGRQYRVVGSAVLLASGRPLPPLSKILASHALIHAAEGEYFREVFSKACEGLDLPVTGLRELDLDECFLTTFWQSGGSDTAASFYPRSFSGTALDQGSEDGCACCITGSGKAAKVISADRATQMTP